MNYWLTLWTLCFFISPVLVSDEAKTEKKLPIVFIDTATKSQIADLLKYPAQLQPKVNAAVLSDTDGVVEKILAPLGRRVRKNQPLIRITNIDPVYDYAPVIVRATVPGVVSSVDVTVGSRVIRGEKLAHITDPRKIRITVEIASEDISEIKRGFKGILTFSSREKEIGVKVIGVSPFVDPATGTATAELALLKPKEHRLSPGLLGRVSFKVRIHNGFQVPQSAITYRGKKPFLRLVKENKVNLVEVELGQMRRGLTEIKKGLKENDVFVVRANKYIREGEEVKAEPIESGQYSE